MVFVKNLWYTDLEPLYQELFILSPQTRPQNIQKNKPSAVVVCTLHRLLDAPARRYASNVVLIEGGTWTEGSIAVGVGVVVVDMGDSDSDVVVYARTYEISK